VTLRRFQASLFVASLTSFAFDLGSIIGLRIEREGVGAWKARYRVILVRIWVFLHGQLAPSRGWTASERWEVKT
jgi:hypothetical protein